MNRKSSSKKWIIIIGGWIVTIVAAIIGTFTVSSGGNQEVKQGNNSNNANNSVVVNIDGYATELDSAKAQNLYNDLKDKVTSADEMLSELQTKIQSLEDQNSELASKNERFENYGVDALVSKNEAYDSEKISLFALEPVNSDCWEENVGTLKDSLGNNYTVTLPYIVIDSGSYGEYYNNGRFSRLQGKIAPHEEKAQENLTQIKIYADDILVYSSSDIDRKTECFEFDVDINKAKFVKVSCEMTSGYGNSNLLLMDATLVK